ncbi:hypothetical protein QBC33DRAFT_517264 [Phialemonium atrogriseum]|uniref:Uncharacterized protein n=1 Tax=Phialemonium atrogriseum TaxID=1093897 RepID=A0AAJ0BW37_9PEZI|nr:uncharacterized protein QBC33DRAFT_517264 [Phialemonium atrogriseum]KAK1765062.1 hypothetical protein QBC33DRAFT_517264 [Phialemonium atrogriseum]
MADFNDLPTEVEDVLWQLALPSPRAHSVELRSIFHQEMSLQGPGDPNCHMAERIWRTLHVVLPSVPTKTPAALTVTPEVLHQEMTQLELGTNFLDTTNDNNGSTSTTKDKEPAKPTAPTNNRPPTSSPSLTATTTSTSSTGYPSRLRHIAMIYPEQWSTIPDLVTDTVTIPCHWCGRFHSMVYIPWEFPHRGQPIPTARIGAGVLDPPMRECCLSRWVLQRFAGMECFYFVVAGLPRPSAAQVADPSARIRIRVPRVSYHNNTMIMNNVGAATEEEVVEPLRVLHSANRVYYEVVMGEDAGPEVRRARMLLEYLCYTFATAPMLAGNDFVGVKFKILSFEDEE